MVPDKNGTRFKPVAQNIYFFFNSQSFEYFYNYYYRYKIFNLSFNLQI